MVFSSIPVFVDPPNWNQQQQQQQNLAQANNGSDSTQLLPPLAAHQPPHVIGSNSIRPGSMADRARLAKIPPPEPALKCPRCESTNTKFCYFNNYSLSQPRHFCKTCRRYWTRGGALRNVPVGGGSRRDKKNKRSNRSKSPSSSSDHKQTVSGSTSAILPPGGNGNSHTHELIGQLPQPHNLPFMASLQNLNRYAVGNMDHMGFQIAGGNSSSGMDQWRLHHQNVPNFLNGFESTNSGGSSYPFQNDNNNQGIETASGFGGGSDIATNNNTNNNSSRVSSQIPSVKMEESGAMNHLSRASLNASENNNQFYSWTDMSGSATHYLL